MKTAVTLCPSHGPAVVGLRSQVSHRAVDGKAHSASLFTFTASSLGVEPLVWPTRPFSREELCPEELAAWPRGVPARAAAFLAPRLFTFSSSAPPRLFRPDDLSGHHRVLSTPPGLGLGRAAPVAKGRWQARKEPVLRASLEPAGVGTACSEQ